MSGGGWRHAPGRLPDLFKAEKYDEVVSAADGILKGDPLNAVALSYKGFASFYRAVSQNALEEKMPYLDQAIVSLRRARLVNHAFHRRNGVRAGQGVFQQG